MGACSAKGEAAAVPAAPCQRGEDGEAGVAGGARLPVAFLAHGGGPMPLLGDPGHRTLTGRLEALAQDAGRKPEAVLVVSAHWEGARPAVTSASQPELLYDYHGFPSEAYAPSLTYGCPGAPWLADRVCELLRPWNCSKDAKRGLDHGVFVPMKLAFPEADVPIAQVSLLRSLDSEEHLCLGEALAPLRDEGVLIVGSGMTFHNMDAFFSRDKREMSRCAAAFDEFLADACSRTGRERAQLLAGWARGPHARTCHPREEHLLPLLVCAGAAAGEPARHVPLGEIMGMAVSNFYFGAGR